MHRRPSVFAGLLAAGLGLSSCGDSVSEEPGAGGASSNGGTSAQPPSRPTDDEAMAPVDGASATFAASEIFLGDSTREGLLDDKAWKEFGFDLDGKISTASSTDLCQPYVKDAADLADQKDAVYPDGDNGIDNSFGKILLPILVSLGQSSTVATNAILNGNFTLIMQIDGVGSDPSYSPLTAKLYGGAKNSGFDGVFDGNDEWPLMPEFLDESGEAKVQFTDSYMRNNVWVSGDDASDTVRLTFLFGAVSLDLAVHHPVVTMELSEDRSEATNGTIAGIIKTEELIEQFQGIAGSLDPNLCDGPTFDTIADKIRGASDIISDGTQDPSQTCDGISLALGFNMKSVSLGPVADPSTATGNACSEQGDGGSGGGGGSE